jgi:hypothetical protein
MRALCSALVFLLLVACSGEVQVNQYPSSEAARAAGAVQRGWVPNVLPSSAVNIIEKHDLDTNQTWGRFQFAAIDSQRVRESLVIAKRSPECPRDAKEAWWPHESVTSGKEFSKYRSSNDVFWFAIDWQVHTVYFWRCAS